MGGGSFRTRMVRSAEGRDVPGTSRTAYIHNWDYHLVEITIYADGLIDCWGLLEYDEFRLKVQEGWIVTQLPEGSKVHVPLLGSFTATDVWNDVIEVEFVQEVADLIDEFKGRPTSRDRCLVVWERFKRQPNERSRKELKAAYEAVPAHLRDGIFGDQDSKDYPIRAALYGSDGIPTEPGG